MRTADEATDKLLFLYGAGDAALQGALVEHGGRMSGVAGRRGGGLKHMHRRS